jgi:hypothetical protein
MLNPLDQELLGKSEEVTIVLGTFAHGKKPKWFYNQRHYGISNKQHHAVQGLATQLPRSQQQSKSEETEQAPSSRRSKWLKPA